MSLLTIEAISKATGSTHRTVSKRLSEAQLRPTTSTPKSALYAPGAAVRAVLERGERGGSHRALYQQAEDILARFHGPAFLDALGRFLNANRDNLGLTEERLIRVLLLAQMAYLTVADEFTGHDGPDDEGLSMESRGLLAVLTEAGGIPQYLEAIKEASRG